MQINSVSAYSSYQQITFTSSRFVNDVKYKKLLQQGLKTSYGIDCKIEDLDSIAGPQETKFIIDNLKGKYYKIGENFRAQFHLHTDASDGHLTLTGFLEQCIDWANHIAKQKKHRDNLPPFSASITDHDTMIYDKKAIAEIAQNPEKYKNFKFITGCEFLFNKDKNSKYTFEAVGLGFNPFDNRLEPLMKGFESDNHIQDAKIVQDAGGILSWAHPLNTPEKLSDEFAIFLKQNGINGIEEHYQYLQFPKDYIDELKPDLKILIRKFDFFSTGGTDTHNSNICS